MKILRQSVMMLLMSRLFRTRPSSRQIISHYWCATIAQCKCHVRDTVRNRTWVLHSWCYNIIIVRGGENECGLWFICNDISRQLRKTFSNEYARPYLLITYWLIDMEIKKFKDILFIKKSIRWYNTGMRTRHQDIDPATFLPPSSTTYSNCLSWNPLLSIATPGRL
jgi:hypothetical protein